MYCSKYLPDIIKEQKTYKDGKLQKVTLTVSQVVYQFASGMLLYHAYAHNSVVQRKYCFCFYFGRLQMCQAKNCVIWRLFNGSVPLSLLSFTWLFSSWLYHNIWKWVQSLTSSLFVLVPFIFPGSGRCVPGYRWPNHHRGSHQGTCSDSWTSSGRNRKSSRWRWWLVLGWYICLSFGNWSILVSCFNEWSWRTYEW